MNIPKHSADNGGRTGWPPGLLQDDCRALWRWFATRPGALWLLRQNVGAANGTARGTMPASPTPPRR